MTVRDAVSATAAAVFLIAACGGEQRVTDNSPGDGSADQADATDAAQDTADADGAPVSPCTAPPDGGMLAQPEVVASGRSGLLGIGTSDAGAVWAEWGAAVFLASSPPKTLFGGGGGGAFFRASNGWFDIGYGLGTGPGYVAIGGVATGAVRSCALGGACEGGGSFPSDLDRFVDVALDGSNIYTLWAADWSATQLVTTAPLDSIWNETKLLELGTKRGYGIAVDDSRVYVFVGEDFTTRSYSIRGVPKSGGPATTLASGVDPEQWDGFDSASVCAHHGTVAWAHWSASVDAGNAWLVARYIEIVANGSAGARTLVDEPAGIACGLDQTRPTLALDDEYVYWATVTGFVKRIRLCGGQPEIIAADQANPVAIAVDDNAVYWLDYGSKPPLADFGAWQVTDGKVMRMRKLGAPGYLDAGTDASGGADASSDFAVVDASDENTEGSN